MLDLTIDGVLELLGLLVAVAAGSRLVQDVLTMGSNLANSTKQA